MKAPATFTLAAALAVTLSVAAAPAHAVVFANFSPDTDASDFRWINSGPGDFGTGGHFFSISNSASTVAQGVAALATLTCRWGSSW